MSPRPTLKIFPSNLETLVPITWTYGMFLGIFLVQNLFQGRCKLLDENFDEFIEY